MDEAGDAFVRREAKRVSGAPIASLAIERALIRRKDRPLTRAVQEFLAFLRPEIARAGKRGIAGRPRS